MKNIQLRLDQSDIDGLDKYVTEGWDRSKIIRACIRALLRGDITLPPLHAITNRRKRKKT